MAIAVLVIMFVLLGIFGFFLFKFFVKGKEQEKEKEVKVPTTQDSLPFEYLRSGIVKLKNGGYRIIVELPSINIDLMEGSERQSVLEQYREILNSLDFSIQILQQSRIVDISDYLQKLETLKNGAKSNFVHKQLGYYSNYLVDLIKDRSILTKKFYVVIPYDEEKDLKREKIAKKNNKRKVKQNIKTDTSENGIYEEEQRFEKAKKQLYSRATLIERSFRRFEITPTILNDNDLLDLFYTSYNKDRAVYQPIKDKNPADYTTVRVKTRGDM